MKTWHFGLNVSLVSYTVFLLAEYLRPGFVTTVFSVHWFLLAVIVFWVMSLTDSGGHVQGSSMARRLAMQFVVGILFAFILWRELDFLDDMRFFVALSALILPFVIWRLVRQE